MAGVNRKSRFPPRFSTSGATKNRTILGHHPRERRMSIYRRARLAAPMTQEHLAEAAGIDVRTLRKLENGQRVSPETVMAVRSVLDMDRRAREEKPRKRLYSNMVVSRTPRRSGYLLDPIDAFQDDKLTKLICVVCLMPIVMVSGTIFLVGFLNLFLSQVSATSSVLVMLFSAPILVVATWVGRMLECIQFNDTHNTLNYVSRDEPDDIGARMAPIWAILPPGWDGKLTLVTFYDGIYHYQAEIAASKSYVEGPDGWYPKFNDAIGKVIFIDDDPKALAA
jgi:transcriptional regulator with XRE-family HTH domain